MAIDLDEAEILKLTSNMGGIPVSFYADDNPFKINDKPQNVFLTNCLLTSRSLDPRTSKRLTLVERTMMTQPRVSIYVKTKATTSSLSKKRDLSARDIEEIERPKRERTVSMNELVQRKRAVYRANVVIEKQNKTAENYERKMQITKFNAEQTHKYITNKTEEIKLVTNTMEKSLIAAKKELEMLSRENISLTMREKSLEISLGILRADNSKMMDPITQARNCKDFLYEIVPTGFDNPFDYFTSPSMLIKEMENNEAECMRMVEKYDEFENRIKRCHETIESEDNELFDKVQEMVKKCDEVKRMYREKVTDKYNSCDEYNRLSKLINETYAQCFEAVSENLISSPIEQLKKISDKYNEMQTFCDENMTSEIEAMIMKTIKARKREASKQKFLEGLTSKRERKFPQVRNKGHVKKGNNRKLNERYLPLRPKKGISLSKINAEIERKQVEALLFNDID